MIRVGFKPSQLLGEGTEYLVVEGMIIAKFFNGKLICDANDVLTEGNDEITKVA